MFTSRASLLPARRRRVAGLTMIELIIFIVIISIAVIGVLQMLNLSTRMSADPLRRKQALMLAEGLLEEVQLSGFTVCDPVDPAAETATVPSACAVQEDIGKEGADERPYNNVSDYVTAWRTPQAAFDNPSGALVDAAGNVFNVTGYTAQLTITGTDTLNKIVSSETPAGMNVLRVTVKVTYGTAADENVVLDGYRTRYAPTVPPT